MISITLTVQKMAAPKCCRYPVTFIELIILGLNFKSNRNEFQEIGNIVMFSPKLNFNMMS